MGRTGTVSGLQCRRSGTEALPIRFTRVSGLGRTTKQGRRVEEKGWRRLSVGGFGPPVPGQEREPGRPPLEVGRLVKPMVVGGLQGGVSGPVSGRRSGQKGSP